ncbi:DUF47 domain-containing protein [Pajaroellobacter abortibovis]|uniref:Phosphate transport regulator n=1 Tax=Pajaroellobacter abortibovis TaxID=1882918 RepID=A0A1L6MXK4_9BACT|nr:DUF47 family protein [Pajaroellobacter abortibovis]APS00227.1 hypothetical protein BCY86_05680 [Pajaroellobacter abortibovis]
MKLQELIRLLLPKEEIFFNIIEQQTSIVYEAAQVLAHFSQNVFVNTTVRDTIQELEHQGDRLIQALEESLARTFITPIDREDIHKLAIELDDILDLINLTARSFFLYGVEQPSTPMKQLAGLLVESTAILKEAIPSLRKHDYTKLREIKRAVKKIEKEGDIIFREAMSNLFHDSHISAKVLLREKEILESLEAAIDHCEEVSEFLANLAVKHG